MRARTSRVIFSRPTVRRTLPSLLVALAVLAGCEGVADGTETSDDGALRFRIAPPGGLSRMADPRSSVPRLRLDDLDVSMQARDDAGEPLPAGVAFDDPLVSSLGATRRYSRGSTVNVSLDWEIDGLPVWRAARSVRVDGDTTIRISSDEYRTDALDTDADGHSNFAELSAGSDPRDPASTPGGDGVAADFAGEWVGAFIYAADLSGWFSYNTPDDFFAEVADDTFGPEDGLVGDLFYLRIDASGALTSFNDRFDEYQSVAAPGRIFATCVTRYTGTITAVSEDRYIVDAGPVFLFGSDVMLIERRRADPRNGDLLWFSRDSDGTGIALQPYDGGAPSLDSLPDC